MVQDREALGKYLADARVEVGITQLELAKRLGYGTPQYISNWERGVCSPPISKLRKITTYLKIERKGFAKMVVGNFRDRLYKELKLN